MIGTINMKACPFCASLDIDAQFWAAIKEEGGPVVHGPGCMDCGAHAETVELWNTRPLGGQGCESVMVDYRTDLLMFEGHNHG